MTIKERIQSAQYGCFWWISLTTFQSRRGQRLHLRLPPRVRPSSDVASAFWRSRHSLLQHAGANHFPVRLPSETCLSWYALCALDSASVRNPALQTGHDRVVVVWHASQNGVCPLVTRESKRPLGKDATSPQEPHSVSTRTLWVLCSSRHESQYGLCSFSSK